MIYFQSRYLSEKLSLNLAKWKRWVREFLPPDPLGGLQSGYARQLNLKDAFKVYLGGYLVADLKFSIPEAKKIVIDLSPWLKRQGFFKLHLNNSGESTVEAPQFVIYIYLLKDHGPAYAIRGISSSESLVDDVFVEKYTVTLLETEIDPLVKGSITGARVLAISTLYRDFVSDLQSLPKAAAGKYQRPPA